MVEVLVVKAMADQVVEDEQTQTLPNPTPGGFSTETPEDRARRQKEIDEQREREQVRRFVPPGYKVVDRLPIPTQGKLKKR